MDSKVERRDRGPKARNDKLQSKAHGRLNGREGGNLQKASKNEHCRIKVLLGIEPRLPESESEVLPLHHRTVLPETGNREIKYYSPTRNFCVSADGTPRTDCN